jgi:O-antigen/teichoic acid export membrane protein
VIRIIHAQKSKIQAVKDLLRLRPFDTTTPDGRAAERKRRVALAASSSAISQAVKILVALITVPLLLNYLGNERYGMWLTISSIIAIVRFADFGIGNGLLNAISEANGKEDEDMALGAVSSAFVLLLFVALVLSLIFFVSYRWIPWERVFNVSSPLAIQEAGPAITIFALSFLVSIPLAITEKVQRGYQEAFWNDLWLAVGSLLGLVGIFAAMRLQAGSPGLILALVGAPVLALLINGLILFGVRRPGLRPQFSKVSNTMARGIANLGVQFFILQIAVAVAYTADRIVIAQIMGAEMVPQYGVPQRLFGMVSMLVGFVLIPLWPAYGEALAQGDFSWIRRTLFKSIRLVLLVTLPASLFLVVFGNYFIDLWVGSAIQPTFLLLLGLGLWTVISSVGNALAMALNGLSIIRLQVFLAVIMAAVNLTLSIVFTTRYGVAGPVWGSVISYTFIVLIPTLIYLLVFKIKQLEKPGPSSPQPVE